jgi:uncharacterized protein (DUF58 family)
VFLSVCVGFAAINTGNNLLYLLLGWQLSFIIASGVLSEMTLRGLLIERRAPPRIYVNEPFLMEVVVNNAKSGRASYSIEVEDLVASAPIDKRCYFLKVPGGKSQRASYRHSVARRGMYGLSGYRVATKFPFALFRKSRDVDAPLSLVVFPARVTVPRPASRSPARGDLASERVGRRGDFFGLREHRLGDDRRDVHWKSSARTGRLLVREYEDEMARRLVIAVDNALPQDVLEAVSGRAGAPRNAVGNAGVGPWSPGYDAMPPAIEAQVSALERAISTAASLASAYLEAGWAVELVARGCHIAGGTGRIHDARISRALALLPYVSDEVAFAAMSAHVQSVLVQAGGSAARGKPRTHTVIHA